MVLGVLILVFSSLTSLETWELVGNNRFDLLESWGVARVKRADEKIKEKFPEPSLLVCELLHKTSAAPFTAIILYRTSGRLLCMGSIVDTRHILTAKRCYDRTDVADLLVLVGYYRAYWGRFAQVVPVNKIVRHEYEIALLRLKKPLKYTEYVQAARLPTAVTKMELDIQKVFPGPYKVVGFFVDRFDVPGDYIDKEKEYKIKEDAFFGFDDCKKNYTKLILEPTKLFCVMGNATYCWGGWGSPVLKKMPNSYYLQVGVVIADNCSAETTGPFLVARTDVYGDWIRGNSFHGHQPS